MEDQFIEASPRGTERTGHQKDMLYSISAFQFESRTRALIRYEHVICSLLSAFECKLISLSSIGLRIFSIHDSLRLTWSTAFSFINAIQ